MPRVIDLEKALGFRYERGFSLVRPAKLLPGPVRELEESSSKLKHHYVDLLALSIPHLSISPGLRQEISELFDKLGPRLWPDGHARATATWLVDAGTNNLNGFYPRDLYYNNLMDRGGMALDFGNMVVAKCCRYRSNQDLKLRKDAPYDAGPDDDAADFLVPDHNDSESTLSSLSSDSHSDDTCAVQMRDPSVKVSDGEQVSGSQEVPLGMPHVPVQSKRDSLIVRLGLSGKQQLRDDRGKESAVQTPSPDTISPSSAQNVKCHEMARSCRGCRRSRKGCDRKKPCGRCQERGRECCYSDETRCLPHKPYQEDRVLASNASQDQCMTPPTSAHHHALDNTTIADKTPAAIGLSADEAPIRPGQSIGSIIPVSSHQQRPAPTAYMGDYGVPPASRGMPSAVGTSYAARADSDMLGPSTQPCVAAKRKRETGGSEAERSVATRAQSLEQVTKVKVELVDLTSSDDHKPQMLAQDHGRGRDAVQSASYSVNDRQRAASLQLGPPTPAPSHMANLDAPAISNTRPTLDRTQLDTAGPFRHRHEDVLEDEEEEEDLELRLEEVQLKRKLRAKKRQRRMLAVAGAGEK